LYVRKKMQQVVRILKSVRDKEEKERKKFLLTGGVPIPPEPGLSQALQMLRFLKIAERKGETRAKEKVHPSDFKPFNLNVLSKWRKKAMRKEIERGHQPDEAHEHG